MARSQRLDALLVDRRCGRPIATITLEPSELLEEQQIFSSSDSPTDGSGGDGKSPADLSELTGSPVLSHTTFSVSSFSAYIAPLWRHLQEEKLVLVDMDRTLVDNAITVRSVVGRALPHWHLFTTLNTPRPGAAAGATARAGMKEHVDSGSNAVGESNTSAFFWEHPSCGARSSNGASKALLPALQGARSWRNAAPVLSDFEWVACEGPDRDRMVPHPSSAGAAGRGGQVNGSGPASSTSPLPGIASSSACTSGFLSAFLNRTASQREALGTVQFEDYGLVDYEIEAATSRQRRCDKSTDPPPSGPRGSGLPASTAVQPFSDAPQAEATAESAREEVSEQPRCSEVIYIRPGVRQFLYVTAVQWGIPVILITKSTRSRTLGILSTVLDPYGVIFRNYARQVVSAEDLLAMPLSTTLSPSSSSKAAAPKGATMSSNTQRIVLCRKSIRDVLRYVIDRMPIERSRQATRPPLWCNVQARLAKPRSVVVLDDAPQVWREEDWRNTVYVAPYTLNRIDPSPYLTSNGYLSSLVMSCLYGMKCLVCANNVFHDAVGSEWWPHCVCACWPSHAAPPPRQPGSIFSFLRSPRRLLLSSTTNGKADETLPTTRHLAQTSGDAFRGTCKGDDSVDSCSGSSSSSSSPASEDSISRLRRCPPGRLKTSGPRHEDGVATLDEQQTEGQRSRGNEKLPLASLLPLPLCQTASKEEDLCRAAVLSAPTTPNTFASLRTTFPAPEAVAIVSDADGTPQVASGGAAETIHCIVVPQYGSSREEQFVATPASYGTPPPQQQDPHLGEGQGLHGGSNPWSSSSSTVYNRSEVEDVVPIPATPPEGIREDTGSTNDVAVAEGMGKGGPTQDTLLSAMEQSDGMGPHSPPESSDAVPSLSETNTVELVRPHHKRWHQHQDGEDDVEDVVPL